MQGPSPVHPLPLRWEPSTDPNRCRRRRIGELSLLETRLARFNDALGRATSDRRQLDADQILSSARVLLSETKGLPIAPCIYDRLRWLACLRQLMSDRGWDPERSAADCAELLLSYLYEGDELIPHDAPVIGHLDDAILTEAAWPRLSGETADYLDYRRLRRLEAELRGEAPVRIAFRRDDWLQARDAERRLFARAREQGLEGYARHESAAAFRVH